MTGWKVFFRAFGICAMTVCAVVGAAESRAAPQTQRQAPSADPRILRAIPATPTTSPCSGTLPTNIAQKPYVAPTHYLTLPPAAFSLGERTEHSYKISSSSLRAWRDPARPGPGLSFVAPLFLPQGVIVRQIELFLRDDDPNANLGVSLVETYASSDARPQLLGQAITMQSDCINSTSPGMDIMLITGLALPIDTRHAYAFNVSWMVNNYNNATSDNGIQVFFLRVGYTLQ